ncbi:MULTISPECIES: hypothetical protein [unclassified Mucilaginibacter]|uniref:hypothetical protein n=1 Tax=unclassified Mucilaginibacter TaxID=2617802 RepID=UPI002AC8EF52|nr:MULTISPECIES: hypothetical protein [unclassified Mucilaginibacter]MEB0262192.1 hypothetical protein [Mucilaginibacter sp. 10I4]MEB0277052.1 hypothetical protein [Mucilaginibacter sp. 10B2]MEB0302200.1 hypothetical protein [Mucilaginibacter sp. 5C4]WPX25153.1 hypothetical protein RHM67_07720 [Mucilaginibacter sp. 5C4]
MWQEIHLACRTDWGKSTTIVNKTGTLYQKIKYLGKVIFAENGKNIERISD